MENRNVRIEFYSKVIGSVNVVISWEQFQASSVSHWHDMFFTSKIMARFTDSPVTESFPVSFDLIKHL